MYNHLLAGFWSCDDMGATRYDETEGSYCTIAGECSFAIDDTGVSGAACGRGTSSKIR